MNELIQLLYLRAHEQQSIIVMNPVTGEPTHMLGHEGVPMYHMVFDPEKFAQLMVNHAVECVWDVSRDLKSNLSYDDAVMVQTRIRQFFGVEE